MIQDGKFGKMVLGDAYLKYYRSPEYYKSAGWRGTWELDGGGALMNQGVHGIDEILWLMGPVKSVFARCDHLVRDIEVEDTAVILVEYESGAYGIIEGTTSVYPGMSTRVEVHGELGTAIIDEAKITTLKFLGEEVDAVAVGADDSGVASDPRAIATYGRGARSGHGGCDLGDREPMIPGEEHRKAVDLIPAIYESARTRKCLPLLERGTASLIMERPLASQGPFQSAAGYGLIFLRTRRGLSGPAAPGCDIDHVPERGVFLAHPPEADGADAILLG